MNTTVWQTNEGRYRTGMHDFIYCSIKLQMKKANIKFQEFNNTKTSKYNSESLRNIVVYNFSISCGMKFYVKNLLK